MNTNLLLLVELITLPLAIILGLVIGYLYKQNKVEKEQLKLKDEAESPTGFG